MAPNKKKKKKVASTSTRGFATTSAPSKTKNEENERGLVEGSDGSETHIEEKDLPLDPPPLDLTRDSAEQQLELSPEELGEQLENSELQLLIDKHGELIKKTISRQVSKLHTERRLFRAQAVQMRLYQRLTNELVQLILNHVTANNDQVMTKVISGESEDGLLMKIWTLYRILTQLGFSDSHRDDALKELLKIKQTDIKQIESESKDSLWGLEFCFNLLARSVDSRELPGYDENRDQALKQRLESNLQGDGFPVSTLDDSRPSTPFIPAAPGSSHAALDSDTASTSPHIMTESESGSDSDLEPDEMTRKYVEWQTRRFQLSPQDGKILGTFGLLNKHQNSATNDVSQSLARLDSRIAKMKSDILFDLDKAEQQWAAARINLVKENADRNKLGINKDMERVEPSQPKSAAEEVEEEADMLGELFSSLPETNSGGDGNMTITNATGLAITIRDFGKWSGITPRRVLEESCRAR